MSSRVGGRRRGERAASALELSIVALPFLLLIFLGIQGALYFYGRHVALEAAREGVSGLRLEGQPGNPVSLGRVEHDATAYARGVGSLSNPTATAVYDPASGRVLVTVTGSVVDLLPFGTMTVSQTASGEIERFEPDPGTGG